MVVNVPSYSKVYAIGHRDISGLFDGEVTIEEKIDGSQFSFGILDGEFSCRSKGVQLIPDAPEKMFITAVEQARSLPLEEGVIYRAEYLSKPKHNTLAYGRVPLKNLCLFDVDFGNQNYIPWEQKKAEADRLGIDCVPMLFSGKVDSLEMLTKFMDMDSFLGGTKIEGFVVKNYELFTSDKKMAVGKYVTEAFKEVHNKEWKKSNPTRTDVIEFLISEYKTPARWQKAVQHLAESGNLDGSPKDIGPLLKEVQRDIIEECSPEISAKLLKHFLPQILRGSINGLPEWYKEKLLGNAFHQ